MSPKKTLLKKANEFIKVLYLYIFLIEWLTSSYKYIFSCPAYENIISIYIEIYSLVAMKHFLQLKLI